MICVSIGEKTAGKCIKALRGVFFAEIRLDKMMADENVVKKIFSGKKKLIATCMKGKFSDKKRLQLLESAVESGASFVDIGVFEKKLFREKIILAARKNRCKVIISFHDFKKTPSRKVLGKIIWKCFSFGADIAKIACKVNSAKDNARLLGLLDCEKRLVVVGMGEKGKITRVAAPLLGAEFSFASLAGGKETASGQMNAKSMEKFFGGMKNA